MNRQNIKGGNEKAQSKRENASVASYTIEYSYIPVTSCNIVLLAGRCHTVSLSSFLRWEWVRIPAGTSESSADSLLLDMKLG